MFAGRILIAHLQQQTLSNEIIYTEVGTLLSTSFLKAKPFPKYLAK